MSTLPPPTGWVLTAGDYVSDQGLLPQVAQALRAFAPRGPELSSGDFDLLHATARHVVELLPEQIQAALSREVDANQARLFASRFKSLVALLSPEGPHPLELDVLLVGLSRRTIQVLYGRRPRASRVRAVVDFYYSQAAVVHHLKASDGVSLERLATGLISTPVGPGIGWGRIEGMGPVGPVRLNVLTVRGARLRAVAAPGGASLAELATAHGATAAVSGGFFLYSEPDIQPPSQRTDPVGLLVSDGQVRSAPSLQRSALLVYADGTATLGRLGPTGCTVGWAEQRHLIAAVNDPKAARRRPVLFNRAWGTTSPKGQWAVAIACGQVTAVGQGVPIPLAGGALTLPEPAVEPAVGAAVTWSIPPDARHGALIEAMAGGPRLLHDGALDLDRASEGFAGSAPPVTFSQDETFDQNLLPRMAVGQRPDGALVFVAADGRDFYGAPGLTLRQTAELLRALGCTQAINLDGGSSKRMVVCGEGVDQSTTELVSDATQPLPVRPVYSAILIG